jgi:WD40 repeat protein
VKSVTFDNEEAMVASGSASGSIKLWDLEEAKGKLIY